MDYSQSVLLTLEDYVATMAEKTRCREEARLQSDLRRDQAQARRRQKEEERLRKDTERAEREMQKEARLTFKTRWTKDAIRQAGERMQQLVKNPPPPAPGDYIAPYLGNLPRICKTNMALRLAKRRAQKFNTGNPHNLPNGTAPPWVHRLDPRYIESPEPNSIADQTQPMPVPLHPSIRTTATADALPVQSA